MRLLIKCVIAICVFITSGAYAQSFSLATSGNLPLNNGDTVTISGTTSLGILFGHLNLTNNSAVTKSVLVQRDLLYLVPGNLNYFDWGIQMYPPFVNLSTDSYDVPAGSTNTTFNTTYECYSMAGTSYVRFTFFDENNPADNTWMVFKFEATQATGLNELGEKNGITIYPNPAGDFINVQNPAADQQHFTMTDSNGKLVMQKDSHSREFKIDLLPFPKGIYFILAEDKIANTHTSFRVVKN